MKYGKGNSGLGACYSTYRAVAKKKDIPFELTLEEFDGLSQGDCFYCGAHPIKIFAQTRVGVGTDKYSNKYIYNGIDRVENEGCYVIENCVSCCKICNFMKATMPMKAFLHSVKKIYQWIFEGGN